MVQLAGPVNIDSETGTYEGVRAKETTVAVTRKPMTIGGKKVPVSTVLDPDFVSKLPRTNKQALVDGGYIELMPASLELVKG
jgi:hypothetical protein